MTLCEEVGHCYMHPIRHATWTKIWCCQCESYVDQHHSPSNGNYYQDGDLIDAYCVKCKEKRTMVDSVIKTSDSGRRMAQGKCKICGTKLNRILAKVGGAIGDYL